VAPGGSEEAVGNPMDLFRLDGKVALVTGAGSGLGRQFAEVMAEAGADVACADIDAESAKATASAVEGLGRCAAAIGCDVTDEAQVAAMVTRTVEVLGRLDILFNNAGIADPEALLLHEYPTANWRAVLNVDLDGVFFCAREALKVMVGQQSGKIINIASIWGLAGSSSLFPALAYNAAKGAVINLTRELGLEYATQGIQVNALCPGFYRTNLSRGAIDDPQVRDSINAFIPMGRIAEAAEIKGPALFLASAASDYMTGQTLVADGGCLAK
jgi:NAD(P)-dependent dehydrogenase (short-subunit alcohol dehydrogenase family)